MYLRLQNNCVSLVFLFSVVQYCQGRGSNSDTPSNAPDETRYIPDPVDPVPLSEAVVPPIPPWGQIEPYTFTDLDYFERYYEEYENFINTENFTEIQRNMTNDTKVCRNVHLLILPNNNLTSSPHPMGFFPCPMPFEPEDFTMCCGESLAQFCCFPLDTANLQIKLGSLALGLIFFSVFIIGLSCYCCAVGGIKGLRDKKDDRAI